MISRKLLGNWSGSWFTDIGDLNQVILLREFEEKAVFDEERERCLQAESPFGGGEELLGVHYEGYRGFPFMGSVEAGDFGPVYELRTYHLRLGGTQPTIEGWKNAVPQRSQMSPVSVVMYALDGAPRFSQIWPYKSLEERSEVRARAVADGIWPPVNGPKWLTGEMKSTIMYPTRLSGLK